MASVKKLLSFILTLLYFNSAMGTTIHQHYCMGELVGISLFNTNNQSCEKCGMKKHTDESKDCCKDVSIVVKTGDSHTYSQSTYTFNIFSPAIPDNYFTTVKVIINLDNNSTTLYRANSPPLPEQPLFIRHRNFRI